VGPARHALARLGSRRPRAGICFVAARCFKWHGRSSTAGRSPTQADPLYRSIGSLLCSAGITRHDVRRCSRRDDREGDAPSFLMPRKDDFDSADIASDMLRPDHDRACSAPTMSSDDRERHRSSALVPAKSLQADTALVDALNHDRSAEALRSIVAACAAPTTSNPPCDGLFWRDRRREAAMSFLGMMGRVLNVFSCLRVRPSRGGALDRFRARLKQTVFARPFGRKSVVCTLG
jgi:hypothetical protein